MVVQMNRIVIILILLLLQGVVYSMPVPSYSNDNQKYPVIGGGYYDDADYAQFKKGESFFWYGCAVMLVGFYVDSIDNNPAADTGGLLILATGLTLMTIGSVYMFGI